MREISFHTLHGFLGHPQDWPSFPNATHHSLYEEQLPYWDWAESFNSKIEGDVPKVLMGYSLGGRLAMHALVQNPKKWAAAVIISAHPGLNSPKLKQDRISSDLAWSEKFRHEAWETLIEAWNGQPVFAQSKPVKREESSYSRHALSNMLELWSLGQQDDLNRKLKQLSVPILWIVGEDDHKFSQIPYPENHPRTKKIIIKNASHRVPWDQPKRLYQEVDRFITNVKELE